MSYWIVHDTDEDLEVLGTDDPSDEAWAKVEAAALELYQESNEILLRVASHYVPLALRQMPTNLDAAEATFVAFREK